MECEHFVLVLYILCCVVVSFWFLVVYVLSYQSRSLGQLGLKSGVFFRSGFENWGVVGLKTSTDGGM